MRSKRIYNYSILRTAVNIVNRREMFFLFFFKPKTFASKQSLWQQQGMNSGVRLPNHYSHAKLQNFLPMASKDFYHFLNIIYYL